MVIKEKEIKYILLLIYNNFFFQKALITHSYQTEIFGLVIIFMAVFLYRKKNTAFCPFYVFIFCNNSFQNRIQFEIKNSKKKERSN